MIISRKSLIIYYNTDNFLHHISTIDMNVHYICKNMQYLVVYFYTNRQKEVIKRIVSTNGFARYEFSNIINENHYFEDGEKNGKPEQQQQLQQQ